MEHAETKTASAESVASYNGANSKYPGNLVSLPGEDDASDWHEETK